MRLLYRALLALTIAFISGYLVITALPNLAYFQAGIGIAVGIAGFWIFGLGRNRNRERLKVGYDFLTVTLFAIFFLSIIFGGLGGIQTTNQASINIAQFLISFWAGGVIMSLVTMVVSFHVEVGKALFSRQLVYITLSFGMFYVTNILVPPTIPVFLRQSVLIDAQGTLSQTGKFVTTIISLPEETVFRGWVAPWLGNISGTGIIGGTIGSAILFTVYHLFAYGTIPAKLIIIFGDGLIQGFDALKTKVLSTTIATHMTANFISVNGFTP